MNNIKIQSLILIVSIFIFHFSLLIFPQAISDYKYSVSMVASDREYSDLEKSLLDIFKTTLAFENMYSENDAELELLLALKDIEESNKLAISVTVIQRLPDNIINEMAKQEVFYSQLNANKKSQLPSEGKLIREYVSAEYLKQFGMVIDNHLEIVDSGGLDEFVKAFVNKKLK